MTTGYRYRPEIEDPPQPTDEPVPWLRPSPPRTEVVRKSVRPNSPVMAFEHLLGKVEDVEIAKLAKVSPGMVRKVRKALGIAACPAQPRRRKA
jgi:hypothetical protein